MTDFDPDQFIKGTTNSSSSPGAFDPDKFIQGAQDSDKPDPGYPAAAGRALRGLATGVESTIDTLGSRLPWSHDPKLTREVLTKRPPPKDPIERWSGVAGEVLPGFAVPSIGLEGLAARTLPNAPRIASFLGKAAEGMVRGGIGGSMIPEDDRFKHFENTVTGEIGGIGTAVAGAGLSMIPWQWRRPLDAIVAGAATKALESVGILPGSWQFPMFLGLLHSRLTDLAARTLNRINPAAVGATSVQTRKQIKGQ